MKHRPRVPTHPIKFAIGLTATTLLMSFSLSFLLTGIGGWRSGLLFIASVLTLAGLVAWLFNVDEGRVDLVISDVRSSLLVRDLSSNYPLLFHPHLARIILSGRRHK